MEPIIRPCRKMVSKINVLLKKEEAHKSTLKKLQSYKTWKKKRFIMVHIQTAVSTPPHLEKREG